MSTAMEHAQDRWRQKPLKQLEHLRAAIEAADRAKIVLIGGSVRLLAADWESILSAAGVADSLAKGHSS